eukprot:3941644-Rhodomonas_salina.12
MSESESSRACLSPSQRSSTCESESRRRRGSYAAANAGLCASVPAFSDLVRVCLRHVEHVWARASSESDPSPSVVAQCREHLRVRVTCHIDTHVHHDRALLVSIMLVPMPFTASLTMMPMHVC